MNLGIQKEPQHSPCEGIVEMGKPFDLVSTFPISGLAEAQLFSISSDFREISIKETQGVPEGPGLARQAWYIFYPVCMS